MKKMFLAAAAVALSVLTACNEELGPEYSTAAEFGEVRKTPVLVTPADEVSVEVVVNSTYGLNAVWVAYFLNDDIDSSKSSKTTFYQGQSQTSVIYKAQNVIPAQEVGTKVSFQVLAMTPFSVLSGTQLYTYTVTEADEPIKPDDPVVPVE